MSGSNGSVNSLHKASRKRQSSSDKIKLSKKQLEIAFDSLVDAICIIEPDYHIVRVNKSYARMADMPIRSILGKTCHQIFWAREGACAGCPAKNTIAHHKVYKKEMEGCPFGGSRHRQFLVQTYPVLDDQENLVSVVEHFRDITEEKRINEQLIRSEKLASIGIMTAGIAHEMNNPLSGLSGIAVNMLKMPEKYGINEKGQERIGMMLECAARATMIMNDLLRLSHKQEHVRIKTDIAALIERAVKSVRIPGTSSVSVAVEIEPGLPQVRCDPPKIEQAAINIITNAFQALAQAKKSAENDQYQGELHIRVSHKDEKITVAVEDNGVGIQKGMESRIFDPFFTTRAPGKGAGLGLSICHRIIEEHQGKIAAESSNGKTVVWFTVPVGKDPLVDIDARIVTRKKKRTNE